MQKRCFFLILLFAAVIILPLEYAVAGQKLRIATEGAYPPFNYINAAGELVGFDVDIAMALCESLDAECTIEAVVWDDLLPALTSRKIDVIVASMASTPERQQHALFTNYYYRSRSMFVGNPTNSFIQTAEGLKGMILAAQEGTVQEDYLNTHFAGTAIIKTAANTNACFAMLAKGEADAILSDSLTIYDFLQTEAGERFDFVGTPLPANDTSSIARIAVRKDDSELAQAINNALKEIRLTGVYDKINLKYFPFSIY